MIKLIKNFSLRLIITIVVFSILKIKNVTNLPLLVGLLFVFDLLDCGLLSFFPNDCGTSEYQRWDKIIDLVVYILFFALFRNLFDDFTKNILIGFILFRLIGVIKFYTTGNTLYLKLFPDFINSTLAAYVIYQYFDLNTHSYYVLIIIGMIVKILFEMKIHSEILR